MAKQRIYRKQAAEESLGNIIASFAQELSRASLAADVMRVKMKNAYDTNDLLRQFDPAKIKIVTARVSIPVAFTNNLAKNVIDTGVSKEQLERMISKEVPTDIRQKISTKILQLLGKQNLVSDDNLGKRIEMIASKLDLKNFDVMKHIDYSKLKEYKNQWTEDQAMEQEARFIYKAEDLEKINPNNVVRFDITLDVS